MTFIPSSPSQGLGKGHNCQNSQTLARSGRTLLLCVHAHQPQPRTQGVLQAPMPSGLGMCLDHSPCQYQQYGERLPRLSSPICTSRFGRCNIVSQQHLPMPQLPAPPAVSSGSANESPSLIYSLGAFQTAVSLGLGVRPYASPPGGESQFPIAFWDPPPQISPIGFLSQILWCSSLQYKSQGLGCPIWGTNPSLPQKEHLSGKIHPYCESLQRGCGFCKTFSLPLLPVPMRSFYPL